MATLGTIVAALALIAALVVALAALARYGAAFVARIGRAEAGVRRLLAFQSEALALESARGRFRRRQRRVERVVDSGTRGVESAHRSLAGRFGWPDAGEGVYRQLRRVNRTLGRGVSGLFAPASAARRRQPLTGWRARREREERHTRDDDNRDEPN